MKTQTYLSEDKIVRRAVKALMTALGPVETARFLTLPHPRRLESVKRHRQWQARLKQKEFFDQVFKEPAKPGAQNS